MKGSEFRVWRFRGLKLQGFGGLGALVLRDWALDAEAESRAAAALADRRKTAHVHQGLSERLWLGVWGLGGLGFRVVGFG